MNIFDDYLNKIINIATEQNKKGLLKLPDNLNLISVIASAPTLLTGEVGELTLVTGSGDGSDGLWANPAGGFAWQKIDFSI